MAANTANQIFQLNIKIKIAAIDISIYSLKWLFNKLITFNDISA